MLLEGVAARQYAIKCRWVAIKFLVICCGLWDGKELLEYHKIFSELNIPPSEYRLIGFEAFPLAASYCRSKYSFVPSLIVENLAVSHANGLCRLYKNGGGGPGNSLFPDKNNVDHNDYVSVRSVNIIDYLNYHGLLGTPCCRILRMNIEGSEYCIIRDLVKRGQHDVFDLYMGSQPGVDLLEVDSLKKLYKPYLRLLKLMGISFEHFSCDSKLENFDLRSYISRRL